MATFRSGPRDPVTGRSSAVISPGNTVRASGQTDNERAARQASYTSYEPAAVQASERNARNEASYQQFLRDTGRTATNPYGNEGLFSRTFGISPDKLDYSGITPGGIATLEKVNRLAFDQFMNPRDAQGNIRGMLREGSPTRYGPVGYDPSQATDFGIMGALPFVGPMLQRATRRSGLTIFPEDYGDLGNELGAFPDFGGVDYDTMEFFESSRSPLADPVAATARSNPNATESRDDVFRPFTTDDESPSGAVDYDTVSQFPPAESTYDLESRLDRRRAGPPTVAEIILNEELTPSDSTVIQNIGTGDTGGATITRRSGSDDVTYLADDEGPSAVYPYPERDLPFNRLGTPTSRPAPAATSTAPVDLTAGVGEELLGTRSTAPMDRSDDPSLATVLQSMLGPADVAQMRDRDAEIKALRFKYIAEGMNPTLAFQRARMQVGR